jgi:hypothetical protein
MNKLGNVIRRSIIAIILIAMICTIFSCNSNSSEKLQSGSQYKVDKPVYLSAVYDNFDSKVVFGRKTGCAYLQAIKLYKKASYAFQCEVPTDTIMTIIEAAPKIWFIPFLTNRYFVKLDPDLSRGRDVILQLDRGFEGNLDGLNPDIFSREK